MPSVQSEQLDRWLRAIAYLFIAAGGGWLYLYQPPLIIESHLVVVTLVWATFILAAFPAAIATLRAKYTTEYWCLPLFTGGLTIALIHGYLELSPESVPRVLMISALDVLLVCRWFQLNWLVNRAVREG